MTMRYSANEPRLVLSDSSIARATWTNATVPARTVCGEPPATPWLEAALTIATMPARTGSGSRSQASTMTPRSGSLSKGMVALLVARGGRGVPFVVAWWREPDSSSCVATTLGLSGLGVSRRGESPVDACSQSGGGGNCTRLRESVSPVRASVAFGHGVFARISFTGTCRVFFPWHSILHAIVASVTGVRSSAILCACWPYRPSASRIRGRAGAS